MTGRYEPLPMNAWLRWLTLVALPAAALAWAGGCGSPVVPVKMDLAKLRDGVYEGETWKILVLVQIEKGKIAKIEIKKQLAPQKYTDIAKSLAEKMIEKQSADVDDITGATMSSRHLKRAVQEALLKGGGPFETPDRDPSGSPGR
jgi:major membrane immunogen (membrane-anchored lipoprotein)